MIRLIIIAIIFVSLLILPFMIPLVFAKKQKDMTFNIKSDNVRDPRYFSKSFSQLLLEGISEEKGIINLSKEEPFVRPDQLITKKCDQIVFAHDNFKPKGVNLFIKEIYAGASADIEKGTKLRAIACLDTLTLNDNCEVLRWADGAELMKVHPGCDLGISATSEKRLVISKDCTFRRLYAPEINIGMSSRKNTYLFKDYKIYNDVMRNPKDIGDNQEIENTIISTNDLVIGSNAIVYGNVKTSKMLTIGRNAIVMGNVIADGVLLLEEGVKIAGNVFSQDTIVIGPNVQIGVKPKIKSLIAKNDIILCEKSDIYGYVGCENLGITVSPEEFKRKYSTMKIRSFRYSRRKESEDM